MAVIALAAGCGDDGGTQKDAAIDGPPDGSAQATFQGEYVDWLSTDGAGFCGIMNAVATVRGDALQTTTTPPNGRIRLMVSSSQQSLIDVTPPTTMSGCTMPSSTYSVPGIIVADPAVIATQEIQSARNFTMAELPSIGFTPDPAKAHVFVHVDMTMAAVTVTASHDSPQAFDGTAWAAGMTGVNVFFPNVDPAGGSTMATMGGAVGEGAVPLEAGKITYLTLVGQ